MMKNIEIKDDYLPLKKLQDLENFVLSNEFPYYYNINIAGEDDDKTDTFMFNHRLMIKNKECSSVGKMITDIIMKDITYNNILRSKINLYLKTDSLNFVIASNMVHHIPYPMKFFKEMHRILKKDGKHLINKIGLG